MRGCLAGLLLRSPALERSCSAVAISLICADVHTTVQRAPGILLRALIKGALVTARPIALSQADRSTVHVRP